VKPDFAYNIGDLVSFNSRRLTEEYVDDVTLTGIVIDQRLVFTADNKFLVKTLRGNEMNIMIRMIDDYVNHIQNTT